MDLFLAGARVAARFGMAAGPPEGNAEGDEDVSQFSRFPSGQDNSNVGQKEPQRADELEKVSIAHGGQRLKLAGARPQPGKRNGELGLPTIAQQILGMGGQGDRLAAPIAQTVKGANAETAESRGISALRSFQPPIKIAFRTGGMKLRIDCAVVRFLIDDQP